MDFFLFQVLIVARTSTGKKERRSNGVVEKRKREQRLFGGLRQSDIRISPFGGTKSTSSTGISSANVALAMAILLQRTQKDGAPPQLTMGAFPGARGSIRELEPR